MKPKAFTLVELSGVSERTAFTLVELLVVVTMITVLIAMLAPALDRAIYQAELAACGANIKGLVQGGTIYAMDFRRLYPARHPLSRANPTVIRRDADADTSAGQDWTIDIPAEMRGYVGIQAFLDPLCAKVDMNTGMFDGPQKGVSSRAVPAIYSSYRVNFDWGNPVDQLKAMRKIGDVLIFTPPSTDSDPRPRAFRLLVTDDDGYSKVAIASSANPVCYSSHPDRDGKMNNLKKERGFDDHGVKGSPFFVKGFTGSWWESKSPPYPIEEMRGLCDFNYGVDDGSVFRLNDVQQSDGRLAKLPYQTLSDYSGSAFAAQMPMN